MINVKNLIKNVQSSNGKIPFRNQTVINSYLESLKYNNLKHQYNLLSKVIAANDDDVKLQCINLTLHHLLTNGRFINILDLRKFIDTFGVLKLNDPEIYSKLTYCLLYAYDNTKVNPTMKISVNTYIAKTLKAMNYEKLGLQFDSKLSTTLKEIMSIKGELDSKHLRNAFRSMTTKGKDMDSGVALDSGAALDSVSDQDTGLESDSKEVEKSKHELNMERLDIEKFKTKGSISFNQLLDYINVPFKTTNKPLYEYYDELDATEKAKFMDEYLEFNKLKQHNMELNCLNLSADWNAIRIIAFFVNDHKSIIDEWIKFGDTLSELVTTDRTLKKYSNYFNLLGTHDIANMVISRTLLLLLYSPKAQVSVIKILNELVFYFQKAIYSKDKLHAPINDEELYKVFAIVLDTMIKHCKIQIPKTFMNDDDNTSVFTHTKIVDSGKRSKKSYKTPGVIKLHPYIYHRLMFNAEVGTPRVFYLPMVYPPRPWISPNQGGYLNDIRPFVFHKNSKLYGKLLNQASSTGQLDLIYSNVNYVSSIPWCINRDMKLIINEILNLQDGLPDIFVPPKKQVADPNNYNKYNRDMNKRAKFETFRLVMNSFDDNIMYFPHGVDFRSRIYPSVSGFSYSDEDIIRSVYQYWDAEPFGANGFQWFKYQLAGLFGLDKLPLQQRLEFVEQNMQNILKSAENPLQETWWHKADTPWQFLRHCFEMLNISKFRGPVEEFRTRIPIHLDGSCNGLQHYAALSGDVKGAKYVNVIPNETRQDIYGEIVNIVRSKLTDDEYDSIINKIISRKLIKRPVMTQVYGVTHYGATEQLVDMFYDLKFDLTPEESKFYKDNLFKIMSRLSKLIFSSIDELFYHSKNIQHWLLDNCYRVMSALDSDSMITTKITKPMMWNSAGGFPIFQLYCKAKTKSVGTKLQHILVKSSNDLENIDVRKSINGIAPNFIHSLDASHLYYTSEECRIQNIPFVAVHDSYWTRASNVDELNRVLRQQFVRLHTSDILGTLYKEMKLMVKDCYHLVWFNKDEYPEMMKEIRKLRPGRMKMEEIKDQRILNRFEKLRSQYKPKLYITKQSRFESYDGTETIKKTKAYRPMLVRAELLEPPPRGELDVNEVMDSKYFFS